MVKVGGAKPAPAQNAENKPEAKKETAKPSAAPGTEQKKLTPAEKSLLKRQARVIYPPTAPAQEGGERRKLSAIPEDFDPKVHKPLSRRDFEPEHLFMSFKAIRLRKMADKYDQLAKQMEIAGPQAKELKKMKSIIDRLEATKATLRAAGFDPEVMLKQLLEESKKEEKPAEAAPAPAATPTA